MNFIVQGYPAYAYTGGRPFDPRLPALVLVHGDHGSGEVLRDGRPVPDEDARLRTLVRVKPVGAAGAGTRDLFDTGAIRERTAAELGVPTEKVEWMLKVSWLPLSLESPINDDEEDSELGMFVEDQQTPTPIQSAYDKMLREKIEAVLETLPPREARILRLRFGLENGHTYTLEEVGQKFGLTRERIRQIESKALRRLRHPRRSRQLKEYL